MGDQVDGMAVAEVWRSRVRLREDTGPQAS